METMGAQIRRQRRRLGLTLDELAGRTSISKPYLSLIETGRVPNPPSDEKLRKLEQTLGFTSGQLLTQAHWQRTPRDVRAVLNRLINAERGQRSLRQDSGQAEVPSTELRTGGGQEKKGAGGAGAGKGQGDGVISNASAPIDLDDAYISGVLQELVDRSAGNVEHVTTNAVPVINRVSAGYPKDFTDLSYPKGVADDYVGCPDVHDKDAFAARVHGDSMIPKYREGDIVIFSPGASPRNGDDCFVRFEDGHTTFKRVFFESDEGGAAMIRLQPRNEKYRPLTTPSEKVTGLYKAVYKYQPVGED